MIYRHVNESATQRLLLDKGDIDVARDLAPQDLDAVSKDKDVKTTAICPLGSVFYIALNQKNPILAKPEVRRGYEVAGGLLGHPGDHHEPHRRGQSELPAQRAAGRANVNPYKFDLPKAKALLAKAGYPDGFKVTMDVRSAQPYQGIAEAFQATAREAGVDIEILPGDGKQVLTKYRARKHDLMIYNWDVDYWDPHTNADTFARNPDNSDDAKSKPLAWRNAWAIPEMTAKADAAVLERDTKKRAQMYQGHPGGFPQEQPVRHAVPVHRRGRRAQQRGGVQAGALHRQHLRVQRRQALTARSGPEPRQP